MVKKILTPPKRTKNDYLLRADDDPKKPYAFREKKALNKRKPQPDWLDKARTAELYKSLTPQKSKSYAQRVARERREREAQKKRNVRKTD